MSMKRGPRVGWLAAIMGLLLAGVLPAGAGTRSWTGAVSTNWNNGGNWNGGLPEAGDEVIITNTAVKPTLPAGVYPASGAYDSFSVSNGATVTCQGDTNAVNEASGGSVGTTHGTGVAIFCTNATINGILDANGNGFAKLTGPGGATGGGGAYGGRGASNTKLVYGQVRQPTALGSGGFSGAGGGAIRIGVSNTLVLNGTLRANAPASGTGAGAGGSVWLACQTFQGTGTVQAAGGAAGGGNLRGGGGGRIAIDYNSSSFSGTVSAAGGADAVLGIAGDGQAGTLWEPGRFPVTGAITVAGGGYQYYFPDTNTLYQWGVTITSAWFETHGGRLVVSNLTLVDGTFRYDQYAFGTTNVCDMTNLTLLGDVVLAASTTNNYASCFIMGAHTVDELIVGSNVTLYPLGDLTVTNEASGGTASKPHGMSVSLRCRTATVDGSVNGIDCGFGPKVGPGASTTAGSHGGRGSTGSYTYNTNTYGSLIRPTALGSGGNVQSGGGGFKLRVDGALTVNGIVDMGGNPATSTGPGSGGSLWLICDSLAGTGIIRAEGGVANTANHRGGGGGRVAVEYGTSTFAGTVSVAGGIGGAAGFVGDGETGSLFRCQSVAPGASDDAGAGGVSLKTRLAVNSGSAGVLFIRAITKWGRNLDWVDQSLDAFSNQLNNAATYSLSGLTPGAVYGVWTNAVLHGSIAADGSGLLSLSNLALTGPLTVSLKGPMPGTVIVIR